MTDAAPFARIQPGAGQQRTACRRQAARLGQGQQRRECRIIHALAGIVVAQARQLDGMALCAPRIGGEQLTQAAALQRGVRSTHRLPGGQLLQGPFDGPYGLGAVLSGVEGEVFSVLVPELD